MDHKYKSLLQNIPCRHLITPVDDKELRKQLTKMKDLDVVNFFILGRLTTIKNVLDAATANEFFDKKFAWFVITQVSNQIEVTQKNLNFKLKRRHPALRRANKHRFARLPPEAVVTGLDT